MILTSNDRKLGSTGWDRLCGLVSFLPLFVIIYSFVFNLVSIQNITTHCKVSNMMQTLSNTVADHQYIEYAWQFTITISAAPRMLIGMYLIKFYHQRLRHQAKGFELKLCYVLIIISEPLAVSIAFFNLNTHHHLHYACLAAYAMIQVFLLVKFRLFERQCKILRWKEKSVFKQRLIIANTLLAMQPVSVVLILLHVVWCIPYSYSLLSLMEYVQLCFVAAYTWLSWTLVCEQIIAFGHILSLLDDLE